MLGSRNGLRSREAFSGQRLGGWVRLGGFRVWVGLRLTAYVETTYWCMVHLYPKPSSVDGPHENLRVLTSTDCCQLSLQSFTLTWNFYILS